MPSASAANLRKIAFSSERSIPSSLAHRSNRYGSLRQSEKKSYPISGFFRPCATTRAASFLRRRRDNSEAPQRCSSPMRNAASFCASRCRSASTMYLSSARADWARLSANFPVASPTRNGTRSLIPSHTHSGCHAAIRCATNNTSEVKGQRLFRCRLGCQFGAKKVPIL